MVSVDVLQGLFNQQPALGKSLWKKETRDVIKQHAPSLWKLNEGNEEKDEFFFQQFVGRLEFLVSQFSQWKKASESWGLSVEYQRYVQTELYCNSPPQLQDDLYSLFSFYFSRSSDFYCKTLFPEEEEEEEEDGEALDSMNVDSVCQSNLFLACKQLHELHLLLLCEPIIVEVCCNQIEQLIDSHCRWIF